MKKPKFNDAYRGRYRTAAESSKPGYLQRRMQAYARLQRIRERKTNPTVTALPMKKVARG